jgi:hydroxymethylpyrimidine pyrophosphatase-like HAD family hydrolase
MEEEDMSPNLERERIVDAAWIFDVDGVITNPSEKRVTEPEILDQILKRLEKGEPVALNTGRSIEWVKDRVLNPLIERIKDRKILQNFLAVGEKGGTWAEFDEDGNLLEKKDDNISVPDDLRNKVRDLINSNYSDSMFFDESKLTMISTEMKDGYSLEEYKNKQQYLIPQLKTLLQRRNISEKFKVDPTTIAVDVENKFVGKHFAVKRIIEWVKSRGISPQMFIAFGDSFRSDVSMAQEIHSQGLPVEFVYVGKEDVDASAFPFTIHQTQSNYDKGALEFLKSL